jgi:beta-glucosidase
VANPSGHLPATFPADIAQLPHHEAPHGGDVTYTEGATVGYKWFEEKGLKPAFPFGHGLSYTSFGVSGLQATRQGAGVTAHFRVANKGQRQGAVVPQIYVGAAPAAGWEAPRRLGGWQKVTLEPGQSREVSVTIDPRLLARWDEKNHAGGSPPAPTPSALHNPRRKRPKAAASCCLNVSCRWIGARPMADRSHSG